MVYFKRAEFLAQDGMGVRPLMTPRRAPQANAYCERLIGTTRRECLDFLIPLSEEHLRRLLTEWRGLLQSGETAFIARARPSHHLCRASDETGPAPASITRPARRCLEAGAWWAPSRLPVVTRRLTDLASRGEHRVLSRARYCVGGPAATECRTSTEANTSSQDLNSHGCLARQYAIFFFADHNYYRAA